MKSTRKKFKEYNQNQLMVFPPSIEEMIDKSHPVRVVNNIIESIDISSLVRKYKGGGSSSYHPRMLLKVLVYSYMNNIYSSRKMESAVKENIHFMWLSAMDKPDHNTINRFRSEKLQGVIKKIFSQVVLLMVESGHVDLQSVYTDGTKIESKANRYTFVWGKRIKTSRERISQQLEELWNYTQQVASEELKDTTPTYFDTTDPEEVQRTIDKINEALKDKPIDKKVKQKLTYANKNWKKNLDGYNQQEEKLGTRNSYSKTDEDATFMRMKEDHMQNGQLKPAYNVQISTNEQIVTHYTAHQNPTDTKTLKPHLESFKEDNGIYPYEVITDAGYGSEENYEFLAQNNIDAYVKYNYFDREQRRKPDYKTTFSPDYLHYNADKNCLYCPMGQQMQCVGTTINTTEAGYNRILHRFQAINCEACPIRSACHKGKDNRNVEISLRLRELKANARELLTSEKGIMHRKKRPVDVEPVFGMIKQNRGFRRFLLKGLDKINIELGLLFLAHNLRKIGPLLHLKGHFISICRIFEEILVESFNLTFIPVKNLNF
jgi:transposase